MQKYIEDKIVVEADSVSRCEQGGRGREEQEKEMGDEVAAPNIFFSQFSR